MIVLTGCGVRTKTQKILNVHPVAQPYVSRFEEIRKINIDNLEVLFRPIDGYRDTLGYCQKITEIKSSNFSLKRTEMEHILIVIDTADWNPNDSLDNYSDVVDPDTNMSPRQIEAAEREELVFHELGHCILNRGHSNSTASIMYPYDMGGENYINYYSSYISELFGFTSYAGTTISNDTYASKAFPKFVDRGDIQVLKPEQLEKSDFHETHINTVVPDDHDEKIDDQN